MNIRFLETFLVLARVGSFRVTAETLNITQAAVSNRIMALEQEFSCRLFERSQRQVTLTDEGRRLVVQAEMVLDTYQRLRIEMTGPAAIQGTIGLGAVHSLAHAILPDVVKVLNAEYPALRVDLYTGETPDLLNRLSEATLDVVLGVEDMARSGVICRPLCRFGMFWVGADSLLGDQNKLFTVDALKALPIICYTPHSTTHARILDYLRFSQNEVPRFSFSDSLATMIHFVGHGLGVAPIPAIVIQDELRSGTLRVLDVERPLDDVHYAFYTKTVPAGITVRVQSLIMARTQEFCLQFSDKLARMTGL
ncbi:MAG: LysR family transcriptional regulator [Gluconacetobacter liquefaciens]